MRAALGLVTFGRAAAPHSVTSKFSQSNVLFFSQICDEQKAADFLQSYAKVDE